LEDPGNSFPPQQVYSFGKILSMGKPFLKRNHSPLPQGKIIKDIKSFFFIDYNSPEINNPGGGIDVQ